MAKTFSVKALAEHANLIISKVNKLFIKFNGGTKASPGQSSHWRVFNMAEEMNYLIHGYWISLDGLCFGETFVFTSVKDMDIYKNVHNRDVRISIVSFLLKWP